MKKGEQNLYGTSDSVHRKIKTKLKTRPLLKNLNLVLGAFIFNIL